MNHKLILVEGIPGSGKTTTAKKLYEYLTSSGNKVNFYEEGMSHPADISWQAVLTEAEYEDFQKQCLYLWDISEKSITREELLKRIEKQARHEDGSVLLAYTRIPFPEDCYWNLASTVKVKELCDGRSSLNHFKTMHIKRWSNFAKQAKDKDEINIFECAFLQNHIFELMGVYTKTDDEIYDYLCELIETVRELNPKIIYIKPNCVEDVIQHAADSRKAPNPYQKDWIEEITDWVSHSNYGKMHNLNGRSGVIKFCIERMRIDLKILGQLNVPVTYIERK